MCDHLVALVSTFLLVCYPCQMGHHNIDKVPAHIKVPYGHNYVMVFLIHSRLAACYLLFAFPFIATEHRCDICTELPTV